MKNNDNKQKLVIVSSLLLFVIVLGIQMYYAKFYEEDLNKSLPITATIAAGEQDQESSFGH
jgi:hypothetical protein